MNKMFVLPSISIQIFISVSFIYLIHFPNVRATEHLLLNWCSPEANYTPSSQFKTNLDLLLSSLVTRGAENGYFTKNLGEIPDTVYGLAQCRDDLSIKACQSCLKTAAENITKRCPKGKTAVLRYDHCILCYSESDLCSTRISTTSSLYYNDSNMSVAEATQFSMKLEALLKNLLQKAVSSETRYSSGDIGYSQFKSIFGAVQCTRDLSSSDCRNCLQELISRIPNCCNGSHGAWIYSWSCYLRYDNNTFIKGEPVRKNNTSINEEPNKNNTFTIGEEEPGTVVHKSTTNMIVIIALIIGSVVLLSLCAYLLARKKWNKSRKELPEIISDHAGSRREAFSLSGLDYYGSQSVAKTSHFDIDRAGIQNDTSHKYDLNVIRKATNEFSDRNKLGEGGFGAVYKGKLLHGQEIAVKRLSRNSEQGLHEFKNEIEFLLMVQHRNLVSLLGYCMDEKETLLIYEFVSNTSLDKYIFDSSKKASLDWNMRYNIIEGIARGLVYLHEDSKSTIIHRDLKAGNILLDETMKAKIADFGMARLSLVGQPEFATANIVGTKGYIAPEYALEGLISVKSDVFSFGILLLEIVSGRRADSFNQPGLPKDLPAHAWNLWNKGDYKRIMDSAIRYSFSSKVKRCIHIGLLCVQHNVDDRPLMSVVIKMLDNNNLSLQQPALPTSLLQSRSVGTDPESDEQSLLKR